MNQLTEEQRERVRQIHERRNRNTGPSFGYAQGLCEDIDFLLSLLDGQAAGDGCGQCGGPHDFDTSIPSVVWNQVIRARGLSDYLCMACIIREFARVGQGFTATLWSEEFNGIPIEVIVNGQNAKDASLIQEENNSLRNQINDASQSIVNEADKVGQLMQTAATAMRDVCVEKVKALPDYPASCDVWVQQGCTCSFRAEVIKALESLNP